MDKQQILKALNAGSAWTAKWIADMADYHEGRDTEHLVGAARKALAQIEETKRYLVYEPRPIQTSPQSLVSYHPRGRAMAWSFTRYGAAMGPKGSASLGRKGNPVRP